MRARAAAFIEGFTLVELLVSMAILSLILVVLVSIVDQTSKTWRYTTSKVQEFSDARNAFDTMTRRLSLATLNTYWDYLDASGNARTNSNSASFVPYSYGRQSELRFICDRTQSLAGTTNPPRPLHGVFFQAPLGYVDGSQTALNLTGLDNLLNSWGYYVEFNTDSFWKPSFLTTVSSHYHFRLMEFMQSSNALTIYKYTSGQPGYTGLDWLSGAFSQPPSAAPVHILADNVIALIILPKLSSEEDSTGTLLSPQYRYDSTAGSNTPSWKNQLPPVIQVTMVALDDTSANRLESMNPAGTMPDLGFNDNASTLFTDATQFQNDLNQSANSLEKTLISKRLNYRIFTTSVSVRGAKWSSQ